MSEQEFFGVFIGLQGDTMLLPNIAVAEVLAFEQVTPVDKAPDWWLGRIDWNGNKVPLLSVEAMNGGGIPERTRRSRVVVINSTGEFLSSAQLAFVCEGYPHLVTLNEASMTPDELDADDSQALILGRTRVANTRALIPDLAAIEQMVSRAQGALSAIE